MREILARLAIVGQDPVGLPLVRVTLKDRFGNVIGTRLFTADEYLGDGQADGALVEPGTVFPVRISLKDPGTEAYGYEVDICLRTREGSTCQQDALPFR